MDFETPLDGWFTYLAWNIDLRMRGPFVRASATRRDFRDRLSGLATTLREEGVSTVHPLEVKVIVPVSGAPRYDLALLVHAAEPMRDPLIDRTATLGFPAPELSVTATNSGKIGDTEARDGEILLNHFAGDVPSRSAVEAWKSVAGWYSRVLDVDNSTLLEFTPDSPFLVLNYAVLPGRAVPFLAGQILRPSFHRIVRTRLRQAGVTPLPLIARRLES